MKHFWKRLLAVALAIVMLVGVLPPGALAAELLGNDPAYNREILAALEDVTGSAEEAERYYAVLQRYGLLDEDGRAVESWSITLDGMDVSLDYIRALLGDPATDRSRALLVDGTPITLGDLETILAIEDQIAYLRETYYSGHQWSQEQLDNLNDLVDQINESGLPIRNGGPFSSGIDHTVTASLAGPATAAPGSDYTFQVKLNKAQTKDVTFSYAAWSGNVDASGGDTGTIPAGQTETSVTVHVDGGAGRINGQGAFTVAVWDLKNALFADGNAAASKAVTVDQSYDFIYNWEQPFSITWDFPNDDAYEPYMYTELPNGKKFGNPELENRSGRKRLTSTKVELSGLPSSKYDAAIEIVSSEFSRWYGKVGPYSGSGGTSVWGEYNTDAFFQMDSRDSIHLTHDDIFTANGKKSGYVPVSISGDTVSTVVSYESTVWQTGVTSVYAGGYYYYYYPKISRCDAKLHVRDATAEAVATLSTPAGNFYPGQQVPVTASFSFPLEITNSMSLTVNGQTIRPVETGTTSDCCTFLYTVKTPMDNAKLSYGSASLSGVGANGNVITVTVDTSGLGNATLCTPAREQAFTGIRAVIENPTSTAPEMVVSLDISSNGSYTQWMSDFTPVDGVWTSQSVSATVDGENFYPFTAAGETVTGETLTARIPLPPNTSGGAVTYTADLCLDGNVVMGRYASADLAPVVFLTAGDLNVSLSVKKADGQTDYFEDGKSGVIYAQDAPKITASYNIIGSGFTFTGPDQFAWASSDETVAVIGPDGTITPTGKAGKVYFTLTALNGGVEGQRVAVDTEELTFGAGLTPFLVIPNDKLQATDGQDVTVYWTSNLCDKNGETPTEFIVTLEKDGIEPKIYGPVTGTASIPVSSFTIPAVDLKYDYGGTDNQFKVTVSSTYNGADYSDDAVIDLESQPARVWLGKLNSYYILDTAGSVPITWTVEHLDRRYNSDRLDDSDIFQFRITCDGREVWNETSLGASLGEETGGGTYSGTYDLSIDNFQATEGQPTSYRRVYTVTLQAKNGKDSTWSYDSFLLYVYDADALKIMVDGEETDGSILMSNRQRIKSLMAGGQEGVLALNRDILLKNMLSVNYKQYGWSELADQIQWKSSDNAAASVNYQQGTLFEDIENFSYVSYRPTTELGLSGLSDGRAVITATHSLTGMRDQLTVDVETLKDRLYLFQCYPQAETKLTYTNGNGTEVTVYTDATGAAAVYEENGIASDVYCSAESDGLTYLGTFFRDQLKTGEGDWTKLERYPCNNLSLRRAAYAYLYLKKPDGTPYTGDITFRGGVYVNGEYKENAKFSLDGNYVDDPGNLDNTKKLGADGKLEVIMDQTQWGLPGGAVSAADKVLYVFEISQGSNGTDYYPVLLTIDSTVNESAYVSSGEAVVNFRENSGTGKRPFIASQIAQAGSVMNDVLDTTGKIGPGSSYPETKLHTMVMWWGEEEPGATENSVLKLYTAAGVPLASKPGEYTITQTGYPFATCPITSYTVTLSESVLKGIVGQGEVTGLYLDYYKDGSTLTRRETLPFRLTNLTGVEKAEESPTLLAEVQKMGRNMGTSAESSMDFGDEFVQIALNLVASDSYTTGDDKFFSMQLAPTSDPTKFLGFVEVNIGNMSDKDQVTGVYADKDNSGKADFDYTPGLSELLVAAGRKSIYNYLGDDLNKVLKRKAVKNFSFDVGGYMETLIYYDHEEKEWCMEVLSGGFNAGGGVSGTWNWNTMVGPIPFTASLTIGGTAEVSMDALSTLYCRRHYTTRIGTDYLTQLRIYLYLRFFAGVGFDYAIIAFKLGIFGQIDLDMQFRWLNRPYLERSSAYSVINAQYGSDPVMNGQRFQINGQIGLEFVVKFLFISYEKILCSGSFSALDKETGKWNDIQKIWENDQQAYKEMISGMLSNGGLSLDNVGGQQMLSLNLAPTLEDTSYLEEGSWWDGGGFSFFSLDSGNGMTALNYNTYAYANPIVSGDGELVAFLGAPSAYTENYRSGEPVVAMFATNNGSGYNNPQPIDGGTGYGDSQLSLSGTAGMAVAAWTRQMVDVAKDSGAVLTPEDQMVMLNGTEVFASVYTGGNWATVRLTENSGADVAPVAATNGSRAIVAWRSVAAGNTTDITTFDQKDAILYKIYDGNGWSDEPLTLYNGTSGAVKGIVAEMLSDGTAAVAYTLDADGQDTTTADREIVYTVIPAADGKAPRTVQATKDSYLDENPQLTKVEFNDGQERFVLGWYTEQSAMSDGAAALDGDSSQTGGETAVSDIRLLDFDRNGDHTQLMPDSISQAAAAYDVSITPNFRFTKNSGTIDGLSILWVERAEGQEKALDASGANSSSTQALEAERDVLKGVKFYTYGEQNELVSFTGAVNVAEMGDGTLIDHFDAYVSNYSNGTEVKAVILGTTYGAAGTVTKTGETVGGTTVQYTVPSASTSMYTATEVYEDRIDVPAFLPDYDTVKKGAKTEIWFSIDNKGIHPITELKIQVGGDTTTYENLNFLPGGTLQCYAGYNVPSGGVTDPEFIVTATYDDNSTQKYTGTVYMNLPDIEVTQADIVSEESGKRTIQVNLSNASAAALGADSGTTVRLGFYSDVTCQTEIEKLKPIVIDSPKELKMIDEGGYSTQVIFDVAGYIGENQEIPENGVPVYIKAEVLNDNSEVQAEPSLQNNTASVTCENLKTRTQQDAIYSGDLESNGTATTVHVTLQNTQLTKTLNGNVIVTLLDEAGNVLAEKQSYNPKTEEGFITLNGEERQTRDFTFSQPGASVRISYSNAVLTNDTNARIKDLTLGEIPLTYDEAAQTWYIPSDYAGQASALLTIVPEDPRAAITVNGQEYTISMIQPLLKGSTGIPIEVTAADGETTETYHIVLLEKAPPVNPPVSVPVTGVSLDKTDLELTVGESWHLNATIVPANATNKRLIWTSSDPLVATVDDSGNVTAAGAGTATITVTTASGNKTAVCEVTVQAGDTPPVAVTGVTLNKSSMSLTAGETEQLTAAITPADAANQGLTWTSSDPSVAAVDSSGNVTAIRAGTAIITVTTADGGFTAACEVTVQAGDIPAVAVTGVTLNRSSMSLTVGGTEQLTASITPSNATNKGLTWTSSNPSVATVDSSGNVTAVSAGNATITVTTTDGKFTAACVVTVSSTEMKVEIEEGITEVPDAFKDLESLNTPEKITTAMRTAITQLGIPSGNTAVYDVTLMVNDGSGWKKADASNFPASGLTVTLPYPQGTNSSYRFKVVHMFTTNYFGKTPGTVETPAVTNTADGIRFTVTGLSPISVGWTAPDPERPTDPGRPGTGGGGSGSSSYAVTVTKPEHGKVTASPTSASSGSAVTLTVTPDSGYVLDTLTVTDSRGNGIRLTAQGSGKYTFTMPASSVTVEAAFASLPEEVEQPCDGGADCPSRGFTDLSTVGTWYHEAVDYVLRNGLMNGHDNGLFGPDEGLSRAQLAQILYNREGKPAVTGGSAFTDVASSAWYSDAVAWAAANGIVDGYGSGMFGPDDNITREQLAVMLWRYSGSPAATSKELHFSDTDEISGFALEALRWAVENGILNGHDGGRLDPGGQATRAQAAQMLKNFIESLGESD